MSYILKKKIEIPVDLCENFGFGNIIVSGDTTKKIVFDISGGTLNYTIELRDLYTTSLIDSMVVSMDGTYYFDNVNTGIYYLESIDSINCTIFSGQINVVVPTTTTTTTLPPTTTTTTLPPTTTTTTTPSPTTTTTTSSPTTTTTTTSSPTTTTTTTSGGGGVPFTVKFNNQGRKLDINNSGEQFVVGTMTQFDTNPISFVGKLLDQGSGGLVDETFNNGITIDNNVEDIIIVQQSPNVGKLLIGGLFTTVDATSIRGIARLNSDGSLDTTFNNGGAGIDSGEIFLLDEEASGKYLVLGTGIATYNGAATGHFFKLNADGTLDGTFTVINYGPFQSFITDSVDGRHVLVGAFGGASYTGILKINTDGTLYGAFDVGTGIGLTTAFNVTQAPDNDFVLVGEFTTYQGNTVGRIVKVDQDGTAYDTTFTSNNGSGFNDRVVKIFLTTDNKYIALGKFTQFDSNTVNGIVRLNTDGSYDSSFNSGGAGFDVGPLIFPLDIKEDSGGDYIVSGNFSQYNGENTGMAWRHVKIDGSTGAFIW